MSLPEFKTIAAVGGVSSIITSCLWAWLPKGAMTWVTGIILLGLGLWVIAYGTQDLRRSFKE
jgi:hypothetical protein